MITNIKNIKSKHIIIASLVCSALLIIGLLPKAYAEQGRGSRTTTEAHATEAPHMEDAQKAPEPEHTAVSENETEHPGLEAEKARIEAKKKENEQKREQNKAKLDAKKLEVCKKHETQINQNMTRISERATNQIGVFNKISERTQAFYKEKNLTLANFDALVSDVNAKKAAAEQAIEALKVTTIDFKCDGSDPKGVGEQYKAARQPVRDALKAYKTSVKNLIVGVKSVAPEKTESSEQ